MIFFRRFTRVPFTTCPAGSSKGGWIFLGAGLFPLLLDIRGLGTLSTWNGSTDVNPTPTPDPDLGRSLNGPTGQNRGSADLSSRGEENPTADHDGGVSFCVRDQIGRVETAGKVPSDRVVRTTAVSHGCFAVSFRV